jgi:hypothetical protein
MRDSKVFQERRKNRPLEKQNSFFGVGFMFISVETEVNLLHPFAEHPLAVLDGVKASGAFQDAAPVPV